ncbi:MAG TPA: MerR family transcriptional regulator [Clostridia bacterium]|nr:MerR family transcriptional regulator [Clostridia bacterium]HPQ47518.1 MerR family transcriptional regulator [Clostridia bacterium]
MYTIGSFSKINTVTTKTLRLYDEMGLLKPAKIDHFTGYRYYTSDQLPRMHRILALKSLGFSLSEIKKVIEDEGTIEMLLESKLRETRDVIRDEKMRLLTIKGYLEGLKGDKEMNQNVIIKSLPGGIIYSKRMVVADYDAYFEVIPQIGEEVTKANPNLKCAVPEYCFIIYHDKEYKEKDIDVEYCEMVTEFGNETETIKFKKLEPVEQAACILHKGPYSTLSVSYGKLHEWLENSGYEPTGPDRESYIDGIWNKEDPEEWLTEIQVPVKAV